MTTLDVVRVGLIAMAVIGCATSSATQPAAPASPSTAAASPSPGGSPNSDLPIGSWTQTVTAEDLKSAGFTDPGLIAENVGTFTTTFLRDGTWTSAQSTTQPVRWPVFRGTYAVTAPGTLEMRTTFPSDYAGEIVTVEWSRGEDGLRFRVLSPPDPLLRFQFEAHPWAPSS